jgi:glycosyltransferase involved in cell wall biosynthesis
MSENKPLRILRIIARLNVGGPARHVILLTEKFREKGWISELAVGEVGKDEASMEDMAFVRNIHPIKIDVLGREIHPTQDLLLVWKLFWLLHRLKPDIVHTHTAKAGGAGRAAAFLYRRFHMKGLWSSLPLQVYHTFHGHVLHGYFSPFKEWIFLQIERLLAKVSTNLITLSPSLREELARLGVAPRERISIVPLGIELEPYLACEESVSGKSSFRAELGVDADTPLVGIIGRLVPIKDHSIFFRAAASLIKETRDEKVSMAHFVIVGGGELLESLEAEVRELGLEDRCHFVGWRSDLPLIYESLNLVALTSRNEGTPLSLIEAMAAACPIVATSVGGVPDLAGWNESGSEIPEDGFDELPVGALVRPGDKEGMSRAMKFLLEDGNRAVEMGRAGRNRVRERYSINRLANDLEALYLKG